MSTTIPDIGLGILSWKAHQTLRTSLESHRMGNLFSLFEETLIFFQEIDNEDKAIAAEFGLTVAGSHENLGIMGGIQKITETLKTNYVLFLENDMQLVAPYDVARQRLTETMKYLKTGDIKVGRMDNELKRNSSLRPASFLDNRLYHPLKQFFLPRQLKRLITQSIYFEKQPHIQFPRFVQPLGDQHWKIDSAFFNWSNRAPLYPRQWLLETIIPYAQNNPSSRMVNGKQDLEKELNRRWWRNHHYPIGICKEGLFIHQRIDRPINDEKKVI